MNKRGTDEMWVTVVLFGFCVTLAGIVFAAVTGGGS